MNFRLPLVRLPKKIDYCLFLIREELKSRHFFNGLHSIGLEDVYFQPHLDSLILKYIGLDDGSDKTFDFYTNLMDDRSKKIDGTNDSITKQALKVYMELTAEAKKKEMLKG